MKKNYIAPEAAILSALSGNDILAVSYSGTENYDELLDQGSNFI